MWIPRWLFARIFMRQNLLKFSFSLEMWLDDGANQMNSLGFKKVTALHEQHIKIKECRKQGWTETVNEQDVGKNII